MFFWTVAALLTLAASLAVLAPLARRAPAVAAASDRDLDVYRDQLAEVDRDVSRALIGSDEAEQARAEIGRRILKLNASRRSTAGAAGWARAVGAAAVLAIPVLSWGLYGVLGSPDLPSQPLEARLSKQPAESSPDELIARAERALRANPGDGRGWDVLAPVYRRVGRANEAVFAYRNAIRLLGDSAPRWAGLGEALAEQSGGTVSADARAAFEKALSLDPQDAQARFFMNVAAAQEKRYDDAIAGWNGLAATLPAGSEWQQASQRAMALAMQRKAAEEGGGPATGPTTEDVAAADQMTDGERGEMIEAMVAALDERLRTQPDDPEGWKRLVRSYIVLGKTDAARDALARGSKALGDPAKAAELVRFARSFGLDATE